MIALQPCPYHRAPSSMYRNVLIYTCIHIHDNLIEPAAGRGLKNVAAWQPQSPVMLYPAIDAQYSRFCSLSRGNVNNRHHGCRADAQIADTQVPAFVASALTSTGGAHSYPESSYRDSRLRDPSFRSIHVPEQKCEWLSPVGAQGEPRRGP